MVSDKGNGFINYIYKPVVILDIIFNRIRTIIRYYQATCSARKNNINIRLGEGVTFYQKTLITGRGFVSIDDQSSFGYIMGGYFHKGISELQPRYQESKIIIGKNVTINNNLMICAAKEVVINDNTLIGEGVIIIDHDAHGINPDERRTSVGKVLPVNIGNNVWIGSKVILLPGTKIGNNSIVGAGSVVKGEFPEGVIIAGNPAKVIREI